MKRFTFACQRLFQNGDVLLALRQVMRNKHLFYEQTSEIEIACCFYVFKLLDGITCESFCRLKNMRDIANF
jgi:hypothetical protein